jgi:hypothetical protein
MNHLLQFICVTCVASTVLMEEKVNEESVSVEPMPSAPVESKQRFLSEPLVKHMFTADPSAHVFNGKIYVYPSHDIESGVPMNGSGDHFNMRDFHVLSMDAPGGEVTDNGVALAVKDIPWASRQLWAPDAAEKNRKYFLYFPVKDKTGIFRIGVATSDTPTGPFTAEPAPIEDSFSVDPAVFKDTDGSYYMYFGGLWGGQLQRWTTGSYDPSAAPEPAADQPALLPKAAKLSDNLLSFAEPPRDVQILDKNGKLLLSADKSRRFFEGSWMHKYKEKYYFLIPQAILIILSSQPATVFTAHLLTKE